LQAQLQSTAVVTYVSADSLGCDVLNEGLSITRHAIKVHLCTPLVPQDC